MAARRRGGGAGSALAEALPHAELLLDAELGLFELVGQGVPLDEAELETAVKATSRPRSSSAPVTRRSARASRGTTLEHGFYFGLGYGVGLEVHEPPRLGLGSDETLVAGDFIAIEPGIEGLEGIGGVRYEDLPLITEDGSEAITRYAYDL